MSARPHETASYVPERRDSGHVSVPYPHANLCVPAPRNATPNLSNPYPKKVRNAQVHDSTMAVPCGSEPSSLHLPPATRHEQQGDATDPERPVLYPNGPPNGPRPYSRSSRRRRPPRPCSTCHARSRQPTNDSPGQPWRTRSASTCPDDHLFRTRSSRPRCSPPRRSDPSPACRPRRRKRVPCSSPTSCWSLSLPQR